MSFSFSSPPLFGKRLFVHWFDSKTSPQSTAHFSQSTVVLRSVLITLPFSRLLQNCFCADLVIEISDVNKQQDGFYRLDYDPPYGFPQPNTTISSRDIGDSIQFSNGLPGTNYNFWLYYTNQTHRDWLTWRVSITTGKYESKCQGRLYDCG